jgi:hypothetical protein
MMIMARIFSARVQRGITNEGMKWERRARASVILVPVFRDLCVPSCFPTLLHPRVPSC